MDMPILDEVFVMGDGFVLNFSNRTFADFFREELQVDIDHPRWEAQGASKAKRLRYYLRQAYRRTALDALNALWDYREISGITHDYPELDDTVRDAFFRILERLGAQSRRQTRPSTAPSQPSIDAGAASSLADRLLRVSKLEPQPRGYAFEKFLNEMFNVCGFSARAPFRLAGEQIDGSFALGDDIYLLEAKWTNALVDAAALRSFNAKVEDKAKWSRGLFLSYSGFSPEGLLAFGRGKSIARQSG